MIKNRFCACYCLAIAVVTLSFGSNAVTATEASASAGAEWPVYGFDSGNSNNNPYEHSISIDNARYLRRKWETFNDDQFVSEPTPSGFILGPPLGLAYPSPVVGVVSSPIIKDGIIYYVDSLGTVFAREAKSGKITDTTKHWTTTLVDLDFDNNPEPLLPSLTFTAPIVTDTHIWLPDSVYGNIHLVERLGGNEVDFDPSTPEVNPYQLVPDLPFESVLGESIIVTNRTGRQILIVPTTVIVDDAVVDGGTVGLIVALDISDPLHPVEIWRTATIDNDPASGKPFGTGVSAGSGLAFDAERGYLIGGTGQNTTPPYDGYPDPTLAPAGYTDRGDSLYAVDIETGKFVWNNQFFAGDVFNLGAPVSTGPQEFPHDADVLAPPTLFAAIVKGQKRDLAGDGSKGGLYRVVDRDSGETVWERFISKPTGIGGIQAGSAYADGTVYVVGFEGIDDGFSDAQFGISLETGKFPNAFFATFSSAFWADVEDTREDDDPSTGMRVKVYALDAATGKSKWHFNDEHRWPHSKVGGDFVELKAGAALRHVSVANGLVYVTTSSGQLFVLNAKNGQTLFNDQALDLNERFFLGLGKPHHASMNGGALIADGTIYVPYGGQNYPAGGVIAYEPNYAPVVGNDIAISTPEEAVTIRALKNDLDANGDAKRFTRVWGGPVNTDDHVPDVITQRKGTVTIVNPGDDPNDPEAAYITFVPRAGFIGAVKLNYSIEDMAPAAFVNGAEVPGELNAQHIARSGGGFVNVYSLGGARRDKSLVQNAARSFSRLAGLSYIDTDGNMAYSVHVSDGAKQRIDELLEQDAFPNSLLPSVEMLIDD